MSADILIRWTSESGAAVRDIGRVNKALGDTATTSDKMKKGLAQAAAVSKVALAAVAAGTVYAAKKAVDQQQAFKGLGVVFKQQTTEMQKWAKQQAAVGLSATQAATAASKLGASLQGAGLGVQQAATQTQSLVAIAADLGAVFGDTQGAVDALGAAMRGEYDPLEQYGIALKQSDVNARLAAKGQDELTGAALKQAEALARLDLIMQGAAATRGAATDADKTAQQQMEILKATMDNLAASMGTILLPAIGAVAAAMQGLADWVTTNQGAATNLIIAVAGLSAGIITLNAVTKAATAIQAAWGTVVAAATSPVIAAAAAITALAGAELYARRMAEQATGPMKIYWSVIGQGLGILNPINGAMRLTAAVITAVAGAAKQCIDFVRNLWQAFGGYRVLDGAASAARAVASAISSITAAISSVLAAWNNLVSNLSSGLPNVSLPFGLQSVSATTAVPTATTTTASTTTTARPVTININGFGGDPDTLARRITSVMARADHRYNRTGLAR